MAKKINKFTKRILELEDKVKRLTDDLYYARKNSTDLDSQLSQTAIKFDAYRNQNEGSVRLEVQHSKDLFEIVRWLANPTTTHFPFKASKEQRDDSSSAFRSGNY